MNQGRRSLLSAIGFSLPLGFGTSVGAATKTADSGSMLRFRAFEDAIREAFADFDGRTSLCRRVEIGHSEQVRAGVQGSHNDRPFAGFPVGHLRIVRTGSEPGPESGGVRLYVSTVDVAWTGGLTPGVPSRPLDFSTLPPAPSFS